MKFADKTPIAKRLEKVWLVNPKGRTVDVIQDVVDTLVSKEYFKLASAAEIKVAEDAIAAGEKLAEKKGRETTPEKLVRSSK